MNAVVRIVSDPYVHVLAVGLLVLRFAMGEDDRVAETVEQVTAPPRCEYCRFEHGWGNPCVTGDLPHAARPGLSRSH
jgi:hypothetical protein